MWIQPRPWILCSAGRGLLLHLATLHGTRSGRMSLKKCVFGCEGKITLFSFPKLYSIMWTVDTVYFSRSAMGFHKCVCWRMFYKPGPVRRCICTSFDTERWSSPSYKRSRSWFRTTDGKWNASHVSVLFAIGASANNSLAPPTVSLGFFRRES